MARLNLGHIRPLQAQLETHPIYWSLHDLDDLRVFMEHHCFSVWDFMSLVKYLQQSIAPIRIPWSPNGDPALRFFINRLVLEEESDTAPGLEGTTEYASHFELYCRAMDEVGADSGIPLKFVERVLADGVDAALYSEGVPLPARYFTETTFCFIREDKPHLVAAALAAGRERLIPPMFRQLLARMEIGPGEAPAFHYYLHRHIHLDEDFHGPLSTAMLEALCGEDPKRVEEAETAAEEAVCARIRFWDGVLAAIEQGRGP